MKHLSMAPATIGTCAGVLFLAIFVPCLFVWPDAQNGIALFLSPFYATWVGLSAAAIAHGWTASQEHVRGLLIMVIGVVAALLFATFLAGEMYQATHPTYYPPAIR